MMVNEKPVPASPCGQYIKTTNELGKGSQRVVHKGNDLRSGRCVAWCEPKLKGEVEWEIFTKTATLLENVKHKNIVSFIEFWEASPNSSRTPVLITEFLGCTLKQHLQNSPRSFDSSALKSWAHQILQAILYLQTQLSHHVIVHRTLRCDHVCINSNTGEVKISSFGTAVMKERAKYLDEPVGAVDFMSPEMASDPCRYNETTDIYSYGICLLEMVTGEYPYEECEKTSQTITCLKTDKYPKILETVECPCTRDLIRGCIEHNVDKRLTLNQISTHRYFQPPLPSGWPKIAFNSFDNDNNMRISISYSDNPADFSYYLINHQTDQARYVAASLVRGEYIKDVHLQDAQTQIHKLIEKCKRDIRLKPDMMQMDYYGPMPQPIPVQTKTPKPAKVTLSLCSFDNEEQHVELELSQTRTGKIVKFQYGILDNEAEEIADKLVKEGHLIAENKAEFLNQLNSIVEEETRKQQIPDADDTVEPDSPMKTEDMVVTSEQPSEVTEQTHHQTILTSLGSEPTVPTVLTLKQTTDELTDLCSPSPHSNTDLSIEVRRKPSRDNATSNHVVSPDIDNRSLQSETSSSIPIDSFSSTKSITNGVDTVISPPIVSSGGLALPPNYYRPSNSYPMLYPPAAQYMMVPPGSIPSPGLHQMPGHHQLPPNYVMMPAGHIPSSIYTNGHIAAGWGHGAPIVRSQHDINSMRMPVAAAHHIPYVAASQNQRVEMDPGRNVRGDQDTPPPGYRTDIIANSLDCRPDT